MNEPPEDTLALQNQWVGIMDFEAVKTMPTDGMELVTLYGSCRQDIHRMFMLKLTERERELLNSPDPPKDVVRSMNDKLDNFSIELAEQIGAPWVYFYPPIANRMLQWRDGKDKHGIRKLKRFHRAVELGAEVRCGKRPATITPGHREVFKKAKIEVKLLLPDLNSLLSQAAVRAVTVKEVQSCAEEKIKDNPNAYRLLTEVLTSFLDYLEYILSERIRTKKPFYDKLPTEAQFVKGWMARAMSRTEKGLAWAISMLGNQS